MKFFIFNFCFFFCVQLGISQRLYLEVFMDSCINAEKPVVLHFIVKNWMNNDYWIYTRGFEYSPILIDTLGNYAYMKENTVDNFQIVQDDYIFLPKKGTVQFDITTNYFSNFNFQKNMEYLYVPFYRCTKENYKRRTRIRTLFGEYQLNGFRFKLCE